MSGLQNYPGRLHKAYLVGLPTALHWMVETVKPVLHPQTVANLKVCEVEDLEMPMRGYLQPAGPESPGTPSDSMANGTVRFGLTLHKVLTLRCRPLLPNLVAIASAQLKWRLLAGPP